MVRDFGGFIWPLCVTEKKRSHCQHHLNTLSYLQDASFAFKRHQLFCLDHDLFWPLLLVWYLEKACHHVPRWNTSVWKSVEHMPQNLLRESPIYHCWRSKVVVNLFCRCHVLVYGLAWDDVLNGWSGFVRPLCVTHFSFKWSWLLRTDMETVTFWQALCKLFYLTQNGYCQVSI